ERFMPSQKFSNPIDMAFASNGDLYMLEYGTRWFSGNDDARLVRIEYNAGNRAPTVVAAVDNAAGATPLRITLSSAGTADADGDAIRYEWTIRRGNGTVLRTLALANPTLTLDQPGLYTATLTATDPKGAHGSAQVQVVAGNEPPKVAIELVGGNQTFFFPSVPIRYAVHVTDREDGSLESGGIAAERVMVRAEYLKEGIPKPVVIQGHQSPVPAPHAEARQLVQSGTCLSCHQMSGKSIGPAYEAVAQKYRGDTTAAKRLATKIREGGTGVWGQVMMPPHPQLTNAQASRIAAYVLSLGAAPATPSLPVSGTYSPSTAQDSSGKGAVVLRASYTDKGANGLLGSAAEQSLVLRVPTVIVATGEVSDGVTKFSGTQAPVEVTIGAKSGAYVGFKALDLTGITEVVFSASAPVQYLNSVGGKVEVRLGTPTGALLGETAAIEPAAMMGAPTMLRASLQPTAGVHDIYFVFRNPLAKDGQNLLVLTTATFGNAAR
ncbi:MAG: c-type cytochrome, partial [bacterium]